MARTWGVKHGPDPKNVCLRRVSEREHRERWREGRTEEVIASGGGLEPLDDFGGHDGMRESKSSLTSPVSRQSSECVGRPRDPLCRRPCLYRKVT